MGLAVVGEGGDRLLEDVDVLEEGKALLLAILLPAFHLITTLFVLLLFFAHIFSFKFLLEQATFLK